MGYLQKKLVNILVHHLFNGITEEDILRIDKRRNVYYRGKKLDDSQKDMLIENAQSFENSTLWRMLTRDMKYIANKRMFDKSVVPEDILAGKMMLYTVSIMEAKLKILAKLK